MKALKSKMRLKYSRYWMPSQIKQYSNALIIELVDNYQKQAVHFSIPWKPLIIIGGLIATIADSLLTDWAPIIKDIISGFRNINVTSLELTNNVKNLLNIVKDHGENIKTSIAGLIVYQRTDTHHAIIQLLFIILSCVFSI